MKSRPALTPDKYLLPHERAHLLGLLERYRGEALRDTTLIMVMLRCGLRPSEALNLTWGDINSSDNSIFVRTLKGGPERVVPMPKDKNLMRRFQAMGRKADTEKVFGISYPRLAQVWDKYRPVRKKLHSLRHTAAVYAYEEVKDPKVVQLLLGHSSLATTDIYLSVVANMDKLRKAIG